MHANRAEHLPARIESLCGRAGVPRAAAHSLLLAAVEAIVHLVRAADGARRIAGVAVLAQDDSGHAAVRGAYRFGADEISRGVGADWLDRRLASAT